LMVILRPFVLLQLKPDVLALSVVTTVYDFLSWMILCQ
jgi:hypothetical protein